MVSGSFVGKQKQSDFPLDLPENAYPVENPRILFPCYQDGLFSYPGDCTKGVRCREGEGQVFTCTDILHFNNATKECDNFCSAHCDPMLGKKKICYNYTAFQISVTSSKQI